MNVLRIVANIDAAEVQKADAFYKAVLGLDLAMDHGWIWTYTAKATMTAQISVATEGGSGTSIPQLSIEVDDLNEAMQRVTNAAINIEYDPVNEPWGVRRFHVRDPFGKLVNILQHKKQGAQAEPNPALSFVAAEQYAERDSATIPLIALNRPRIGGKPPLAS